MGHIARAVAGRLWIGALALLLALIIALPVGAQEGDGYWYIVRRGDSWTSISARTGVSVAELQRANPQAIHRFYWLYRGERLWIPRPRGESGYWYTVQRGDSWSSISYRTGVSVRDLQRANPQAIHRFHWLYRGERLWIPGAMLSPVAIATPTPAPPPANCPADLAGYGAAIAEQLTGTAGNVNALGNWLYACGAITESRGKVQAADLTGDGVNEVIVALTTPQSEMTVPPGDLLVLRQAGGWSVLFRANAAGAVQLLDVGDINQDGQMDIAWTDTTCGAHTCFGTIYVMSWTGTALQNWLDGTLTVAYPEVKLEDVTDGSGREIVVHGGVIGSVGAGPQRAWTETWASSGGAPYVRVSLVYDPSNCLYHTVLDANQALLRGRADNFVRAVALYRKALQDASLVACWIRPNELEELRSFSAFRLAMAYAYQGDLANAEATVTDLMSTYPGSVYAQVADVWWTAYQPTQDMTAACAAVNTFVTGATPHSEAYEMLADYGYANPTFTATDVCPVIP